MFKGDLLAAPGNFLYMQARIETERIMVERAAVGVCEREPRFRLDFLPLMGNGKVAGGKRDRGDFGDFLVERAGFRAYFFCSGKAMEVYTAKEYSTAEERQGRRSGSRTYNRRLDEPVDAERCGENE